MGEVFKQTQPQVTNAIVNSQLKLVDQVSRGTFIVPSFDEIWPQAGKDGARGGKGAKMRMSYDYILDAMQHHGLGHLPQPDNFTTCGRLAIEDMREEKVILDHPEVADKIIKSNAKKHDVNPIAAQKKLGDKFDPKRSSVLMAINATERATGQGV